MTPLAQTPPILALALGYFVVGTGAFVVAGLLNEISADLKVSVATAGQLIGVYSFALALGAPLLAGLSARFQRGTLIVAGLVLFGVLQWVAAVVPDYGLLAVARGLTGVAAAVVTTQSIAAAGLIAAPEQRGQALGTMFLGFSLSVVAGVPLGTVLGAELGWRVALALVGLFSVISALWIHRILPSKMPTESIDTTSWRSLIHNRAILWIVATTVLHSAGQFTLYTYFAPVFRDSLQADAKTIGLLFGWFGACGIAGNLLMNRVTDRVGSTRAVLACLGVMAAAFVVWPLAAGSLAMMLLVLLLWGLGGFAIHPIQQTRLVALAPALASVSVALNLSGTYLAQVLGAAIGGALISAVGSAALSWAGLGLLLAACGATFLATRASRVPAPESAPSANAARADRTR